MALKPFQQQQFEPAGVEGVKVMWSKFQITVCVQNRHFFYFYVMVMLLGGSVH